MENEQVQRLSLLPDWQIRETDKACRTLASEYAKNGVTNEALLSLLNVFATSCLLCDPKFLFYLHELYLFGTEQAMNGDERAAKILAGLNDTLRELAESVVQNKKEQVQEN